MNNDLHCQPGGKPMVPRLMRDELVDLELLSALITDKFIVIARKMNIDILISKQDIVTVTLLNDD